MYELLKHPDVIRQPADIPQFFSCCKNFYQVAPTQIKKRYNKEHPVLSKLQVFDPESALSQNSQQYQSNTRSRNWKVYGSDPKGIKNLVLDFYGYVSSAYYFIDFDSKQVFFHKVEVEMCI